MRRRVDGGPRPPFNVLRMLEVGFCLLVGCYIGLHLGASPSKLETTEEAAHDSPETADQVRKLQAEVHRWKERANQYADDFKRQVDTTKKLQMQCQKQQRQNDATITMETPKARQSKTLLSVSNPHEACRTLFPPDAPVPTATALWFQHLKEVLFASKLPNDRRFKFHDFTAQLLEIVSSRLHRSVRTGVSDWQSFEQALQVGWKRYQFLQLPLAKRQRLQDPPRPLKILVLGGSLLVGTNCRRLLSDLGLSGPIRLPNRDCTWANRLEKFLNGIVTGQVSDRADFVQVTKVAMGGTNTATGSVIWELDLVPPEARNPDIVINAYSTNDMHVLTILEAEKTGATLREKVFDMTQDFVRQVMAPLPCSTNSNTTAAAHPPLLLHMDDYLGNEQRDIWSTTELSQGVQVLANYYGFASMSYADMIRDLVYGDSHEVWLSADWWGSDGSSYGREIHPGMGMHIAAAWVTSFNLLHLLTTYCSLPRPDQPLTEEYHGTDLGMPVLRGDVKQAAGKPHQKPKGLPPRLTPDLLIEEVTGKWKAASNVTHTCSGDYRQRCPFSWVSGLSLQQNNDTWVDEYFHKHADSWEDWKLSGDGGKLGFVPSKKGSRIVLAFEFLQPIRKATVFYMKSYGDKWANSTVHVTFSSESNGNVQQLKTMELVGVHNKTTSEVYTEEAVFQATSKHGRLLVEASLVGGSTFKLMGLALCS